MASDDSEFTGIQCSYISAGRTDELYTDTDGILQCDRHGDVTAVKFCSDHNTAVCLDCANSYHRACKEVDTFKEIAKRAAKGKKVRKFLSDLDNTVNKISKLRHAKNDDLGKLRTETNDALNAITEFRKEINWYLDKLERKGKSFIEKRYKEIHSDLNGDVELCDSTLAGLDKLKKRLEKLEDKTQRFVNMKLGTSKLDTAQRLCKEIKETRPRADFVKMTIDPMVERFVMNLRWYGKHHTHLSMEAPLALPHMYVIKHDTHYDIRCKGDTSVCHIVDACQIKDGTTLLIDSTNQKLKQLDVTYKIVDSFELPGTPVAIATLPDGAAVLLENETGSSIYFVNASPANLKLCESFHIPEKCTGLVFHNGVYFVSTKTTISTYSLSGDFIATLYENTFGAFGHLCVDGNGSKLYVTDTSTGLVTMDAEGGNVDLLNDPSLKVASGVCCDKCNQVFVCGSGSHNVIQHDHHGGRLGALLDHRKDIKCPLSLCYDGIGKRLIVTQRSRNYIKVYQLK